MALEAFFLPAATGQRFCLLHRPDAGVPLKGAVLYVPPFAEEMNKARRMAAVQARAMAVAGYAVLQIDLYGCGDSSGDFGDASWADWVADTVVACAWLREQTGVTPWLWGLRTGCLLACEAARQIEGPNRFVFWQPVLSGKQYLQQFLRLKIAGEMLAGESKGLMERMRATLAEGQPVEIAGYMLSPALASGLAAAELVLPGTVAQVEWIELSGKLDGVLSPAASMRLEQWAASSYAVRGAVVCGPSFWQTTEIEECTALVDATLSAMAGNPL